MNKLKLVFLISLALIVFNCDKEKEKNWVAKVGNTVISEQEYQARLNFSSFLSDIKDEQKVKKIVLSALVAEKLLAEEALNNNYQNEILNALVKQNQKELMIEYLRSDSVDSQVRIAEQDILLEYNRRTKELDVKYITIADLETAIQLKEKISSGAHFEEVAHAYMVDMGWQNETIPTKTIKWYPKQPKMEYALYNQKEGTTSEPLKAFGEYYLVKIEKINIIQNSSEDSYEKKRLELNNRLKEQKIREKYISYYTKNIKPRLAKANWDLINNAVDIYIESIRDNEKLRQLKNNPLPENDNFNSDELISALKIKPAVEFEDQMWTLEEVFQNLSIGPYLFNLESNESLRKSFMTNINLMLEHEAWVGLALDLNYNYDARVMADHNVWTNYYYAKSYQDVLEKQNANISNTVLNSDDYITIISEKFAIDLNKKLYTNTRFIGQDIYLQKQHFANRRATPPLLALGDNLSWQNKINTLLANTEIN